MHTGLKCTALFCIISPLWTLCVALQERCCPRIPLPTQKLLLETKRADLSPINLNRSDLSPERPRLCKLIDFEACSMQTSASSDLLISVYHFWKKVFCFLDSHNRRLNPQTKPPTCFCKKKKKNFYETETKLNLCTNTFHRFRKLLRCAIVMFCAEKSARLLSMQECWIGLVETVWFSLLLIFLLWGKGDNHLIFEIKMLCIWVKTMNWVNFLSIAICAGLTLLTTFCQITLEWPRNIVRHF